jgi:aubergine-like protein
MEKTPTEIISLSTYFTDNVKIDEPERSLLPNPKITETSMKPFIDRKTQLYANLYKLSLNKSYRIYEYSVKFQVDESNMSTALKRKIFSKVNNEINKNYGTYFFTGECMFATNEIKEVINVLSIHKKFQYSILISPTSEVIELDNIEEQIKTKPAIKTILEIMIKDIIRANPAIKFVKNLYGKKYDEKSVRSKNNSISIFPGFTTKIVILENGIYLNVDIKNKILSSSHCLDIIKTLAKTPTKMTKKEMETVNSYFKDKIVETIHSNQRFKIESICFDKRPIDTTEMFEGNAISISKIYKKLFGIDLIAEQPLLLVKPKSKKIPNFRKYLPPQLCLLVGLSDKMVSDYQLMKEIAEFTKQSPNEKVNSMNDIIKLVNEKQGIVKIHRETKEKFTLKSSFQKKEEYGIDISLVNKPFYGYNITPPIIKGCKNGKLILI